jgi:hypothetical protein
MDLRIEMIKILDIQLPELTIVKRYINYDIPKRNIDILEIDESQNRYILDLSQYWFNEYNENKIKPMIYELRKVLKNQKKIECCIEDRECKYENKLGLTTNWGDGITDTKVKHIYNDNESYTITTPRFLKTKDYRHIGKNIKAIELIRLDLIDASWLFSECYYAEDSSFFPYINTSIMKNMSYMFYHCARLKVLDLSRYKTKQVENVSHMFDSCLHMEILDIRNFDLKLVEDKYTDCMFINCINLKELHLENCDTDTIRKIINSTYFPTSKDDEEILLQYNIIKKDLKLDSRIILDSNNSDIILDEYYLDYERDIYNLHIDIKNKIKSKKIYCKKTNAINLVPPAGWIFVYVDEKQ